ncbi:MAG: NAD+ synthase [Spirochaetes bacterium RBG_16_49_21]|nr:MAG: NAD+ synthase [Spirochaetes bacterium RBG_16_49_21]
MRIALAQINPTIADIAGNKEKIISFIKRARSHDADIVVFPEMATIGYPPMDLLENPKLVADNLAAIKEIADHTKGISIICGYVEPNNEKSPPLYNAAAFMRNGEIISRHYKTLLPTYDVFDEDRYFSSCTEQTVVKHMERSIGVTVCEDIWNALDLDENKFTDNRRYDIDPVKILVDKKSDMIISINASPFMRGKNRFKRMMLSEIARKNSLTVVYVNQVGGNDSLVFDGNSVVYNHRGKLIGHARPFEEDLAVVDDSSETEIKIREDEIEEIHRALILGIHDYVHKCGFRKVVIGLSGGIDSALTAVLAVQALGPENVTGVTMPSIYSSAGSIEDSRALAANLGIRLETIPIRELFDRYRTDLASVFERKKEDVTEENIQARIRGNLLMAISNKEKSLVLSTGNKSELAMGYCTLYGDMSGGLAAISDLPKTLVYELAGHINAKWKMIPEACFTKPPSAELRENQKDQDTLPPYEILDRILDLYIEDRKSAEEIVSAGFPEELVRKILHTININEYKRRQAAPGIKVTAKAFGVGRRIPIAQRFRP